MAAALVCVRGRFAAPRSRLWQPSRAPRIHAHHAHQHGRRGTPDRMAASYGPGGLGAAGGILGRDARALASGDRLLECRRHRRIPPLARVSGGISYDPRQKKGIRRTGRRARVCGCRLNCGDAARGWGRPRRDDGAMGRRCTRKSAWWGRKRGQVLMQSGRTAADARQNAGGHMALGQNEGRNRGGMACAPYTRHRTRNGRTAAEPLEGTRQEKHSRIFGGEHHRRALRPQAHSA